MMNIKGIDISNFQKNINLNEVRSAGYEVCYIKATEGQTYIDPLLMQNYNKAKDAGLNIGFYHFIHSYDDGATQAKFMLNKINNLDYNCRIAIDIEVTDNQSSEVINKCIEDFAREVTKQTGHYPIIYTNLSFAKDHLSSNLKKYGLWLAEYGVKNPSTSTLWGNDLTGWQYSENGDFTGSTDLNIFNSGVYLPSSKKINTLNSEKYAIVTTKVLNVRSGAGLNYPVIGQVKQGDKIKLDCRVGDWYSTYYGEHGGFMYASYLN